MDVKPKKVAPPVVSKKPTHVKKSLKPTDVTEPESRRTTDDSGKADILGKVHVDLDVRWGHTGTGNQRSC